MTEQQIRDYAEQIYPPQKGKQWVRTLRNAKVEAFVKGALWNETKGLKISSNLVLSDSLFAFNNELSRCQERLPDSLKIMWNDILANNVR